jgi:hypothetical protein
MTKNISSPIGITGIGLIVVGLVMTIVGLILLIVNQNHPKEWYIWFLLITGAILGIIGGIILAIGFSKYENCNTIQSRCPDYNLSDKSQIVKVQPINYTRNDLDNHLDDELDNHSDNDNINTNIIYSNLDE